MKVEITRIYNIGGHRTTVCAGHDNVTDASTMQSLLQHIEWQATTLGATHIDTLEGVDDAPGAPGDPAAPAKRHRRTKEQKAADDAAIAAAKLGGVPVPQQPAGNMLPAGTPMIGMPPAPMAPPAGLPPPSPPPAVSYAPAGAPPPPAAVSYVAPPAPPPQPVARDPIDAQWEAHVKAHIERVRAMTPAPYLASMESTVAGIIQQHGPSLEALAAAALSAVDGNLTTAFGQ